jgi:hypothetical protein
MGVLGGELRLVNSGLFPSSSPSLSPSSPSTSQSPYSHHRCHPHPQYQPHPLSIPITITTYPSPSPADTYPYQPGPNWLPNVPNSIPKIIPLSNGAIGGGGSGDLKHGGVGTVCGDLGLLSHPQYPLLWISFWVPWGARCHFPSADR